MDDRTQGRPEDRRRRGPLGDEAAEETRRVPRGEGGEGATRRGATEEDAGGREGATRAAGTTRGGTTGEDEAGTRVIRTPGAAGQEEEPVYPSGYLEAAEQRDARLRDIYGGVDWLASFIGCVFAVVFGGLLLLLLAGLVLAPLDFGLDLQNQTIDASVITGLVVVGIALFVAFFVGGYVTGRMVRFDGGRNGVLTVLWGLVLAFIIAIFPTFLPGTLFRLLRDVVNESVLPTIGGLLEIGAAGLGILIGALLLALLGGLIGGRFGNRYHTKIDRTT